jgi:hypothetical protein
VKTRASPLQVAVDGDLSRLARTQTIFEQCDRVAQLRARAVIIK